ncbi:MAG: hypothetical protein ABJG86_09675 [Nitratireductor sp.]
MTDWSPIYSAGTVTVGAGGTTVNGSGTTWDTIGLRAGDQFRAQGLSATIVAVVSNTQLTIKAWAGAAIAGGNYEIMRVSDADRLIAANADLAAALVPNLTALGQFEATGLLARTGAGVFAGRKVKGTAAQVTVTNGDGVAGDPTLSLPADIVLPGVMRLNASGQSGAPLRFRQNADSFEWGHQNGGGYGSTLGAQNNSGNPWLAFSGEHGAASNSFRTRGRRASIMMGDLAGGFRFGNVADANADDQLFQQQAALSATGIWTAAGYAGVGVLGTVGQSGGLPTASLFEKGANASGEYVKFADGSQLCAMRVTMTMNSQGYQAFNYPASFVDGSKVSLGLAFGSNAVTGSDSQWWNEQHKVTAIPNNAGDFRLLYRGSLNATTGLVHVLAFGRWF